MNRITIQYLGFAHVIFGGKWLRWEALTPSSNLLFHKLGGNVTHFLHADLRTKNPNARGEVSTAYGKSLSARRTQNGKECIHASNMYIREQKKF